MDILAYIRNGYESTTDVEKEAFVISMHNQMTTHCRDCFACSGQFTDGQRLQDVFEILIKRGVITRGV